MTKLRTGHVIECVMARHPHPQWAAFSELRDSTGFGHARTMDVAAFNTWKSGKGARIAYEVKVSRADFQRELDQPEKRAWAEQYFHESYFATPAGLVKPTEIPEGWGLFEVRRTKAGELAGKRIVRAGPRKPDELPYWMVCSILRRAATQVADVRDRIFKLEGEEISKERLRMLVEEQVRKETAIRQAQFNSQIARATKAEREAAAVAAPIRDLYRLAAKWGALDEGKINIEQLVNMAVARYIQRFRGDMQAAHTTLGRLLAQTESWKEPE